MERYRSDLNHSILWIVRSSVKSGRRYRVPGISEIHRSLDGALRSAFNMPSRIAIDCYREALAIARPHLGNGANGRIPRVRRLRMRLHKHGYRVKDSCVEIIGGHNLRIVGWGRRYDAARTEG